MPIPLSTGAGSATMEACDRTDRRGHTCPPRAGRRQLPCQVLSAVTPSWPGLLTCCPGRGRVVRLWRSSGARPDAARRICSTLVAETARADGWKCLNVQGVESEAVLSGAGLLSVLSPAARGPGLRSRGAGGGAVRRARLGARRRVRRSFPDRRGDAEPAGGRVGPHAAAHRRRRRAVGGRGVRGGAGLRCPSARPRPGRRRDDASGRDAAPGPAGRLRESSPSEASHRQPREPCSGRASRPMSWPGWCPRPEAIRLPCGNVSGCSAGRSARGPRPCPPALPVPERLRDVYAGELGDLSPGAWRAAVLCAASSDQEAAPVLAALAAEGLDAGDLLGRGGRGPRRPGRGPDVSASDAAVGHVGARLGVRATVRARARWPPSSRTGPLVRGTAPRPRPATTQRWPASWRRSPTWTVRAVGSPPPRGPWNVRPGSLPTPCCEVTGSPRRRRTPTSPVTPTALDGWRPRCSAPTLGAGPPSARPARAGVARVVPWPVCARP